MYVVCFELALDFVDVCLAVAVAIFGLNTAVGCDNECRENSNDKGYDE